MSKLSSDRLLGERAAAVDVSGIRRVFQLGSTLENPINLSIGQPDFPVPPQIKAAAIAAIDADCNGYTLTHGHASMLEATRSHLQRDVGWTFDDDTGLIITSGTSGALQLVFMAVMNDTDEVIVPDPYFVIYPNLGPMFGGQTVLCDTAPTFRMTADLVEPLITDRTRMVLVNSPANPTGVVLSQQEVDDLYDLCTSRGVLLVCDEIYDLFTFPDALNNGQFPSPARRGQDMLLIRGMGKTYGCTGWRLGYAAGPSWLINEMAKFQQYTYVCAPSIAQAAGAAAFEVDMSDTVAQYAKRRDIVQLSLSEVTQVVPAGDRNVLVIPGAVFSAADTHFRLSYACCESQLREGVSILKDMMQPRS
jgi:aminotransferase